MKCPYCGSDNSNVLESRVSADSISIRRRRECTVCSKRFTTYERVEGVELSVIKKNGDRQVFDREKIRKGLMKATWKRPVSIEMIEELLTSVERELYAKETKEVRSWEIGELVIKKLKELDHVSYLLFACVYRDFNSLEDFELEISSLKVKKSSSTTLIKKQRTPKKSDVSARYLNKKSVQKGFVQ